MLHGMLVRLNLDWRESLVLLLVGAIILFSLWFGSTQQDCYREYGDGLGVVERCDPAYPDDQGGN